MNVDIRTLVTVISIAAMSLTSEAKLDFGDFAKQKGGSKPATSRSAEKEKPEEKGDARVRTRLDTAQVKYTVNNLGNFIVSWNVGKNGRSQGTIINSHTQTYKNMEIREVWSVAYKGPRLTRDALAKLLIDNGEKKIGAWEIASDGNSGTEAVIFTVKVPADISADQLRAMSSVVAETADEVEEKLDGGDDL